jgi:hypothetical protein
MDGLEWLLIVIGVLGVLKTLGGGTFAASSSGASATASASGSSAASDSASGQPVVAKKKPLTQLLALVGASPLGIFLELGSLVGDSRVKLLQFCGKLFQRHWFPLRISAVKRCLADVEK